MNYQGALLVERMILESLVKKTKNLLALSEDTGLNENFLKIVLQEMICKGWVIFELGDYRLREAELSEWAGEINRDENLKGEVKELLDSMVALHFREQLKGPRAFLKIQKLELTDDEEKLLNSHLKGLEIFFKNIRNSRMKKPIKEHTKRQKIVVWGAGIYEDLVGANLVAI